MTTPTFTDGADSYTVTESGTYTLDFLGGDDSLVVDGPDNASTIVNATMGAGNDHVQILVGTVTVDGGGGDDWFDVSAPNATLSGGTGNDTYVIKKASDTVIENAASGTDRVFTTFSYTLTNNVENLYLSGKLAIDGWGNALNNIVSGNDADNKIYGNGGNDKLLGNGGNDTLDGGVGHDRMIGGTGNDIYYVDNYNDHIVEYTGEGTDQVYASDNYKLAANVENLTLTGTANIWAYGSVDDNWLIGNTGANKLFGMDGNDTLDGGTGADKLFGGTGNDIYYVDNYNDRVIENAGEGTDSVFSTTNYKLADNIENLTLTGSTNIWGYGNSGNNELTGNDGNNKLFGLEGNDVLHGGAGSDLLNGGAGIDLMDGGTGNDVYYVDNVSDVVTELANEGTDTVHTTVTLTLSDNVENGMIDGSVGIGLYGNGLDNSLTGNIGADTINGGDGNDTIHGAEGLDFLYGGNGNDAIYGDTGDDSLFGDAGNDTLSGGDGNDHLYGGADNDTLDGGIGNDSILGGAGQDTLTGGDGSDTFLFQATTDSPVGAWDTITDFQSSSGTVAGDDVLDLRSIDANASVSGDQSFAWGGETAGANSLWYTGLVHNSDGTADMMLNGDTNGDGVADFQVMMHLTTGNLSTDDILF